MQRSRQHIFVLSALIMLMGIAAGAGAQGFTLLGDNFDAIIERQPMALEAGYFGGQAFLDRSRTSVSGSLFIGGDDVIDSGGSFSIQTCHTPLEVGILYSSMDADLKTWLIAINVQRRVVSGRRGELMLQIAGAHQQMRDSEAGSFAMRIDAKNGDSFADTPYTLLQEVSWNHFFGHAVARFDLGRIHPVLDIGFKVSDYYVAGAELDESLLNVVDKAENDGTRWSGHYAAGLEVEISQARVTGGMIRGDHGDLYFLGGMTVVF